jgi:hypothetical protein
MIQRNTILTLVFSVFLLVSFSTDPPNGKTGAPGDSLCVECHSPQSQTLNGTLEIEGFPAVITPDDTFHLTVINRNTVGDAVKGGFQMTILGPLNTKAGKMINLSPTTTRVQTSGGREYFEHHPAPTYPDSNVLRWNVDWVSSGLPASGTITCYAAGNICNGNFQDSGDRTVTKIVSGSVLLSSNTEITSVEPKIYPNPGSSEIFVELKDQESQNGLVYFYNIMGSVVGQSMLDQGKINVPALSSGVYYIKVQTGTHSYFEKWMKI